MIDFAVSMEKTEPYVTIQLGSDNLFGNELGSD